MEHPVWAMVSVMLGLLLISMSGTCWLFAIAVHTIQ